MVPPLVFFVFVIHQNLKSLTQKNKDLAQQCTFQKVWKILLLMHKDQGHSFLNAQRSSTCLLAVESRDLSQADKSMIRVSSFPKLSH